MNTETEYINGGVASNLVCLAAASGYVPTADELLTIAAHDAMPRGVAYTQTELDDMRKKIERCADRTMPEWRECRYLDLYGVPVPPSRPARMSAYDRRHSTRLTPPPYIQMSSKTPIESIMDRLEWKPVVHEVEPKGLYATHEGVLEIAGSKFRCYQLSDGNRVIDADDVEKFFNTTP